MSDLRVAIGSLVLNNPVLVAAGTFGYGVEFARRVPIARLGGLITKTLTRHPRSGNPPPRLIETPSGLLNSVGLQNMGLDAFLAEVLPQLQRYAVPIIVSVLGESPKELAEMVQQLERAEPVAAIELNLSCPNLHRGDAAGGLSPPLVAQNASATALMVRAAREQTRKPLLAKLSPDVTDLAPIAQAAEQAGATALSLVNTFTGMSIDPRTRRSRLGAMTGGLSGPAIRPLAVYRVWYTAQLVRIPIIGLGGIVRLEDALEFFLAGATAVAVGTANFADPTSAVRIVGGLERYLKRHRLASPRELCGAVHSTASTGSDVKDRV